MSKKKKVPKSIEEWLKRRPLWETQVTPYGIFTLGPTDEEEERLARERKTEEAEEKPGDGQA